MIRRLFQTTARFRSSAIERFPWEPSCTIAFAATPLVSCRGNPRSDLVVPQAQKGREGNEHRFPDRKDHIQMHAYWKVDDAQMKQIDMINFTKNMALVGALLMFLLLPHPWPMSLGIG